MEANIYRLRDDKELLDITNIVQIGGKSNRIKYSPAINGVKIDLKSQDQKLY